MANSNLFSYIGANNNLLSYFVANSNASVISWRTTIYFPSYIVTNNNFFQLYRGEQQCVLYIVANKIQQFNPLYLGERQYFSYILANSKQQWWMVCVTNVLCWFQQYFSIIVEIDNISVLSWRSTLFRNYRGDQQYLEIIIDLHDNF